MATTPKGKVKKLPSRRSGVDSNLYRIPMDMDAVAQPSENIAMSVRGWVMALILVALMLPLLAFLYLDVLSQKQEVKQQTEKVEKLRREVERKHRDKSPDSFSDNPVFDRVRRPF